MVNMNLIKEAVDIAAKLFEQENIAMNNDAIENRIVGWYNHTDITDAYELAVAAWLGDYNGKMNYEDVLEVKELMFPTEPLEIHNYHIGEIEEAMKDAEWQ